VLHGEQTDGVYTIYWDICASGRLPTKHAGIDLDEQSSDREQNGVVPVCEIHRQGPHRFEVGTVMVIHTVNPPTRKAMKERGTIYRDIHPTTEQTVLGVQMVWRRDRRSCATPENAWRRILESLYGYLSDSGSLKSSEVGSGIHQGRPADIQSYGR